MATSSEPPAASTLTQGAAPPARVALVVHGGAWDIPDAEFDAHLDGLSLAIARARRVLERGGPALDAVEEAVAAMEAHGAFDAGRGAVLDRDGAAQLDAGVMCGPTLRWGAVANVRALPHPVRAARHLLEGDSQARLMVGEGAERWAAEIGLPHVAPSRLVHPREQARWESLRAAADAHTSVAFAGAGAERVSAAASPRGTVGCVALDAAGRLAAATSTGGTPFAPAGRVGDSPIVGAGFYADAAAAVSATGWGEALATVQIASRAAALVDVGVAPADAAAQELDRMRGCVRWPGAAEATGGLIVLGADGAAGWAFTTPRMARGGWREGADAWTEI